MSGSGMSRAICKSAPRSRQITTPAPHHSFFTDRMPFLPRNQQRQSTEGIANNQRTIKSEGRKNATDRAGRAVLQGWRHVKLASLKHTIISKQVLNPAYCTDTEKSAFSVALVVAVENSSDNLPCHFTHTHTVVRSQIVLGRQ